MQTLWKYDEGGGKGYIFKVDDDYPKDLHYLHSHLPFLPERMKIIKSISLYSICNKNMLKKRS